MKKTELKSSLTALLSAGKKITFEWDCGGDETLIETFEDGKPSKSKWVDALCEVIAEKLELPNAGEYFVKGTGELSLKKDDVYIKHNSVASGMDFKIPEGVDPSEIDEETFEDYMVEIDDEPIKGNVKLL